MRLIPSILTCFAAIALAGCKKSTEPTVYTVPKEEPRSTTASARPAAPALAGDMANSSFVPPTAGGHVHMPEWQTPANWTQSTASAMRKASYAITHPEGTLDVAVTSFPGDVGGPLANVNRWRQQIGMGPISAAELDANYAPLQGQEPGFYTELMGPETSTLAATFVHGGHSWFFKMTGPTAAIAKEREAFLQMANSVHFAGH